MRQAKTRESMGQLSQLKTKIKEIFQHPDFILWGAMMLCVILLLMVFALIGVAISTKMQALFGDMLDTYNKRETLTLIGWGIGGIFTAMCTAFAIYHHAVAQAKNVEAKVESNRLTEKEHVTDRFDSATENLGRERPEARILSFYQLYYLAKDSQDDDVRRNIFDTLCAHLRAISNDQSHAKRSNEDFPTEECQTLLNVLFKPEDNSVFNKFHANLHNVWLVHANLFNANLVRAEFFGANLKAAFLENANASGALFPHANLENANLVNANFRHANFIGTNFKNANLMDADFTGANLMGANFTGARIQNANFSNAELIGAHFTGANLKFVSNIEGANFIWARKDNRNISREDLPTEKGKYIADWTNDEFWAEVEKNKKS